MVRTTAGEFEPQLAGGGAAGERGEAEAKDVAARVYAPAGGRSKGASASPPIASPIPPNSRFGGPLTTGHHYWTAIIIGCGAAGRRAGPPVARGLIHGTIAKASGAVAAWRFVRGKLFDGDDLTRGIDVTCVGVRVCFPEVPIVRLNPFPLIPQLKKVYGWEGTSE
jgi:hypothetical protein